MFNMIISTREFKNNLKRCLMKSDFIVCTKYHEPDHITVSFDKSLRVVLDRAKAAHREAREYVNEI